MTTTANDYTPLEQAVQQYEVDGTFSDDQWQPKVSIVVNVYNQPQQLWKALLALSQQTYNPRNIEVIIADDGSKKGTGSSLNMVAGWDLPFDVKYIWQPDTGFRLAKARNEGIRRASNDDVICMDADMIPEHTYVEEVMKMRYAAQQAGVKLLTIQDRAFVKPEELTEDFILEQRLADVPRVKSHRFGTVEDWRMKRYAETDSLKCIPAEEKDPTYVIGSTIGGGMCSLSKGDALEAGLIDESFQGWGAEDTEFGIRLYDHFNRKLKQKLFFVPVAATAYHLEHGEKRQTKEQADARYQFFKDKVTHARVAKVSSQPEVSVYIPCYNQEQFIRQAIESVARQQYDLGKLEIVVGEDGSKDRSPQIVQELQRKYAGRLAIRVVGDGQNRGRAVNTNRTVQACRGKYILQLDADDELLPTAVSKLYQALQKNRWASFAFGDCIDRNVQTGEQRKHWSCDEYTIGWYVQHRGITREDVSQEACQSPMRFHHPRMFRRDAFMKTGGIEESLENAIDFDLYLKLTEVGLPLHLKESLYIYNHHQTNTSHHRDLQVANDHSVRAAAAARTNGQPQKELVVLDDVTGKSKYVNLQEPLWRQRNLQRQWQQSGRSAETALYRSLVGELETLVSHLRWMEPEQARNYLQQLQQVAPGSSVAHYYKATYHLDRQEWQPALRELRSIQNPGSSAKSLEARIVQAMQVRRRA